MFSLFWRWWKGQSEGNVESAENHAESAKADDESIEPTGGATIEPLKPIIPWYECVICKSELIYPVERFQLNDIEWKVLLLCPNCLTKRELLVDRDTVRDMLKKARIRREALSKQLEAMKKQNMEEEAEKFISAINNNNLLPIDF